jgi:hypothetical protein
MMARFKPPATNEILLGPALPAISASLAGTTPYLSRLLTDDECEQGVGFSSDNSVREGRRNWLYGNLKPVDRLVG